MPFTLDVQFDFFCSFGPPLPFADRPKQSWVLLPRDRNHFPVLWYPMAQRVPIGGDRVDRQADPDHGSDPNGTRELFALDNEEIRILPNGLPPGEPSLDQSAGLDQHLLRIENAGLGFEVLNNVFLGDGAEAERIAARVFLDAGTLRTEELTSKEYQIVEQTGTVIVDDLIISRRVVLRLPNLDSVVFCLRRFPGKALQFLHLKDEIGAGQMLVTIRNSEQRFVWDEDLPDPSEQPTDEMNLHFPFSRDFKPHETILLEPEESGPDGLCAPKTFDRIG